MVDNKVTVVICPLLSLSHDQVVSLRNKNIHASLLSSETSKTEAIDIIKKLKAGELRLIYLTPEKIAKSKRIMGVLTILNDRSMFLF